MKKYLLPEKGQFYKANMHMHTTVSDGKFTPQETKEAYMAEGYSIIAFTDHETLMPHNDLRDENFLPITSHEISVNEPGQSSYEYIRTYHLNLYSRDPDESRPPFFNLNYAWKKDDDRTFESERIYSDKGINHLIKVAKERGYIVCMNHFSWSLQNYTDYIGLEGLWGAECYNTGCAVEGYHRDNSIDVVDDMLHAGKQVFPVAADDSHKEIDRFGGYIMVKAESLDYDTIFAALERGDFYASTGPEIDELYLEDGILKIKSSGAKEICINTERRVAWRKCAEGSETLGDVEFDMSRYLSNSDTTIKGPGRPFFRVTLIAPDGKMAYSRGYFLDEL